MEESRSDGSMPFLETLVIPQPDSSFSTIVYGKPTHTNLYLQWDSHLMIAAKCSVVNTIHHSTKVVCSNSQLLEKEEDHLQRVLLENKYPMWALNRVKMKINAPTQQEQKKKGTNISTNATAGNQRPYTVVLYVKRLSESIKNECRKHGVQVYCKGGNTIKSLLMTPKDKDPIIKRSGIIYRYKCNRVNCDDEYIGESSRTFGERFREYLKAPSPIYDHLNITGHSTTIENFSIVGREDQNLIRAIKEATYIRVNNPSLNKNIGKCHLPHIWDEVLLNISELKLK